MKAKSLEKKIRRLEKRLREGPKKLARLKAKLVAVVKANTDAAREKAAARQPAKKVSSQKKRPSAKTSAPKKTPSAPAKKVKRKLNLSPERRAQLAEAMRARWAAKRATAGAGSAHESADHHDYSQGPPLHGS